MSKQVPYQAIAQDIGSATVGQLAGTFHYYKDHKADVYAILAIHPAITDTQRQLVLAQRSDQIKSILDTIDTSSLYIVTEKQIYSPSDFEYHKQKIQKAFSGEPFSNTVKNEIDSSVKNTIPSLSHSAG